MLISLLLHIKKMWNFEMFKFYSKHHCHFNYNCRRIAALAEREAGHSSGHTTNTHQPKPTVKSEYKHLAKPEREIQERLDKLKEGPKQTGGHFNQSKQPEREIQERLDKLKEGSKQTGGYFNQSKLCNTLISFFGMKTNCKCP